MLLHTLTDVYFVFMSSIFFFFLYECSTILGFSGSSAGKESTCNAGDPSFIPGSGSSPGEMIGYPLLPAMWETWFQWLGWEDTWRRAWQPSPVFLPRESPWSKEPGRLQSMWSQRVRHDWATKHSTMSQFFIHLFVDGDLGCLQLRVHKIIVTVNIFTQALTNICFHFSWVNS